jgi:hypothetical protein
MSIVQVSVPPGLTMAAAPMDELLDERLAHRGGAGEDAAVAPTGLRRHATANERDVLASARFR